MKTKSTLNFNKKMKRIKAKINSSILNNPNNNNPIKLPINQISSKFQGRSNSILKRREKRQINKACLNNKLK